YLFLLSSFGVEYEVDSTSPHLKKHIVNTHLFIYNRMLTSLLIFFLILIVIFININTTISIFTTFLISTLITLFIPILTTIPFSALITFIIPIPTTILF